jgi:serine protease inhibitor
VRQLEEIMRLTLMALCALLAPLPAFQTAASTVRAQSLAATSCRTASPVAAANSTRLALANNGFGFKLLREMGSTGDGGNVFVSPTSIALALDMAYDGSAGATASAMASTLGVKGLGQASVRAAASALLNALKSDDPKVKVQVANALWARQGITFNPSFIKRIAAAFDAKTATANFDDPSTVSAINDWVSCATHGTITSIIGKLTPDQVMVLLNALYFHGTWATPFSSANTHDGPFTTVSGSSVQIPFMSNRATYAYAEGAQYQAISLPYGDGRYTMRIVLPKSGTSVGTLLKKLSTARWNAWTGTLKNTPVVLKLPRFTIQYGGVLNKDLAALGMGKAFQKTANFTGICPRCFISAVVHKTYLQVDEKGTTASAVTGVVVGTTAVSVNQVSMTVDHPFLVTLQDAKTGSILFAGEITNPAS